MRCSTGTPRDAGGKRLLDSNHHAAVRYRWCSCLANVTCHIYHLPLNRPITLCEWTILSYSISILSLSLHNISMRTACPRNKTILILSILLVGRFGVVEGRVNLGTGEVGSGSRVLMSSSGVATIQEGELPILPKIGWYLLRLLPTSFISFREVPILRTLSSGYLRYLPEFSPRASLQLGASRHYAGLFIGTRRSRHWVLTVSHFWPLPSCITLRSTSLCVNRGWRGNPKFFSVDSSRVHVFWTFCTVSVKGT